MGKQRPLYFKVDEKQTMLAGGKEVYTFGGAERWFPKSNESYQNNFHADLSFNDLGLLEYLTFLAWYGRNALVWASLPFLEKGIPRLQNGSFKRCSQTLRRNRLLYRWQSRRKAGNIWLINPVLLRESMRPELEHFDLIERIFYSDRKDPKFLSDHFDPIFGSKRSEIKKRAGTKTDQEDPEELEFRSPRDGAQRHSPITTEGGVADPGGKVSSGQDHTPGGEGVALTGDPMAVARAARAAVEAKCDEAAAQERADREYREKFRRLLIDQKKWKLSRRELEEKLDALAKEYGKETHFKRGPAHNRRKPPVGKGRGEQVSGQQEIFQSGGKR